MGKFQGVYLKNNFGMNQTRNRLILAFFIPVLLIIALGIISYVIASQGLNNSYETSARSATQGKADLMAYKIETLVQKADVLVENPEIIKYFSGFYKDQSAEQSSRWNEITSLVSREIVSQDFMSNIYIVSQTGERFSGSGTAFSNFDYDEFMQKEGATLAKSGLDNVWMGEHPYLDEMTGSKSSDYAMSYFRSINSFVDEPMGCLVINVSTKAYKRLLTMQICQRVVLLD